MPSHRLPPPPNADNVVSASELVRHFGIWQDRATRSPVYILHRGRPRHVLTSVETMQALCISHDGSPASVHGPDALLDVIEDQIIIVDRDLRIVAASHAARRYFGDAARAGVEADGLSAPRGASHLRTSISRVLATGSPEQIDLTGPFPERRLGCTISPYPGGAVVLLIRDISIVEDLASARGWGLAKRQAAIATGLALPARINLRGYIDNPDASLANFLGVDARLLASVRFVTLIELASRVAVGQMIEGVITTGEPAAIDTRFLFDGASTRAVRIGFAPVRRGSAVEGVAAILVLTQAFRQA